MEFSYILVYKMRKSHSGSYSNLIHSGRRVQGSYETARLTAELLRAVILQHKEPTASGAASLIEAVRRVGEQLIAANPVGKCFFQVQFASILLLS